MFQILTPSHVGPGGCKCVYFCIFFCVFRILQYLQVFCLFFPVFFPVIFNLSRCMLFAEFTPLCVRFFFLCFIFRACLLRSLFSLHLPPSHLPPSLCLQVVLAYLRLAVNEADDDAFLRVFNVPSRGLGRDGPPPPPTLPHLPTVCQSWFQCWNALACQRW